MKRENVTHANLPHANLPLATAMKIILTHEQTDFDALASLLGAYLIDETAVPVLPRRINRNVRAFITIYGAELPFVDPRDLRGQAIESVCLVDTQSLTSIKGMGPQTRVHVIDHHTPRRDLHAEWEVSLAETGANATVFVEAIQERDIHLSIVQATLLLLGIYEDTGSLTYTRTTPRDARAAACLLEQGASLTIATGYLNHPLSLEQQAIYEQLRAAIESHSVHGHTIIVAPGEAREIDEELSTIAHKLRDLLDPDAIILLISVRGGVQLIARSTSDNIDVARLAARFGGGGHPRAAAALIKSGDLEFVHDELIRLLPDHVRPAVTVAEIMSRDPHLLALDTPVHEIAQRMQRYGYEGYPVVENGAIVGLLTRRAVDRAISHKLNLTAAGLMEAGEVSIAPGDSIEQLQNVMTNTGWGQIPVVEPESGEIIGIVTRTDLLTILAPKATPPGKRNLADKLETALPPARLALLTDIAEIAQQQRIALYIVGGFVRDLLLGYPSLDFDLVVEGDAIALARAVSRKFGGRVTVHGRFGTAKWFLEPTDDGRRMTDGECEGATHFESASHLRLTGESASQRVSESATLPAPPSPLPAPRSTLPETLDFITARTEFYTHPTALPTVERGSIKLDLHRRDFTINTLALRLDGRHYGELHDYWGGFDDLRQGLVRILHSISFVDDPTRMLRAVRYEQRYGFRIGKRTLELLLAARPLIDRISGDRIRHELDNIINEENAAQMLTRLHELGLLEAIHPDLSWDDWLHSQISNLEPLDPDPAWNLGLDWKEIPLKRALIYTLWLIRLPRAQARGVIKRLRLPRALKNPIRAACCLWSDLPDMSEAKPSEITARLEKIPSLAIYAAYRAIDDPGPSSRGFYGIRAALQAYVTRWRDIAPHTTGHDLQARGLPPGPKFKQILTT
ncbi:MAG: CBS domain-containing protein, partial [Chloroflexota bacterium]